MKTWRKGSLLYVNQLYVYVLLLFPFPVVRASYSVYMELEQKYINAMVTSQHFVVSHLFLLVNYMNSTYVHSAPHVLLMLTSLWPTLASKDSMQGHRQAGHVTYLLPAKSAGINILP